VADLAYRDSGAAGAALKPVIVGRVVVNFSRAQIDATLAAEVRRKVTEVLLLDLILVAALALSLRIVFDPLKRLRDGLFDLATRGSDEVEELPDSRHDELGEVIRGFNAIQRKVKSNIQRIREAEDEAQIGASHGQGAGRSAPHPGIAAAGRAAGLAGRAGGRRGARDQYAGRHRADQRLGADGGHREGAGLGPGGMAISRNPTSCAIWKRRPKARA
jgi:hypothetical protein